MLERMYIKSFALIEELSIDFCGNLNVLTGETGAGKSIVIDAVSLILGGRAQTEFIRSGADRAVLEAVFRLPANHPVYQLLARMGIECEEQTVILTREISLEGKNTARVNGRTLTLGQYRQIGLLIVDIHGQHDHQALLQSEFHIDILDKFGGLEHLSLLNDVHEKFSIWLEAKSKLEKLLVHEQERAQRIDFLTYQIKEIKQAGLKPDEDTQLRQEAALLANAERISNHLQKAYHQLFGGERGNSAYELLGRALAGMEEIKKIDPGLEKLYLQLEPSLYIIQETAADINSYLDSIEFSPHRLEQVEKRLQLIIDLKKKYGNSIREILDYAQSAETELEKWEKSTELAEELQKISHNARQEYELAAKKLSLQRQKVAALLEERVTKELRDLAMPQTRFSVQFAASAGTAKGLDKVEFLISPNPGEPLLPVAKIASGGELSRIMLAIKTIIANLDEIGTLIFDEIDSGIGGKAAQKVAEKLETISHSQQVICVTHSPLIAALADCHLYLEKRVEQGRTRTLLSRLEKQKRVDELVRMLGGEKQSEELRKHAMQILKKCD